MARRNTLRRKNTDIGVAPVVGFMLILAIVFIAIAQYQLNVVPQNEHDVETDHASEVSQQMSSITTEITRASGTGQTQTQEISTGLTYDLIGLSQPARGGTIAHIEFDNDIVIDNAENDGSASNFWRGDQERAFETGYMFYAIDYNRYAGDQDLYMEHGMMYADRQPDRDEIRQDEMDLRVPQPIFDGRSITLQTVTNPFPDSLVESRIGTTNIELNPTSAPMNSVAISNFEDSDGNSEPIEIQIPTNLDAQTWEEEILTRELSPTVYDADDYDNVEEIQGYITSIDQVMGEDAIVVELEEDETYNLRMSRIDVQTQDRQTTVTSTEPEYVAVSDQSVNIREESVTDISAQVRDRYNNGVIGIETTVEARETRDGDTRCVGDFPDDETDKYDPGCDGPEAQPGLDISDANGMVSYTYHSPEVRDDRDVTFVYQIMDED